MPVVPNMQSQAADAFTRKRAQNVVMTKQARHVGRDQPRDPAAAADGDALVLDTAAADASTRKRVSGGAQSMHRMMGRPAGPMPAAQDDESAIDAGVAM